MFQDPIPITYAGATKSLPRTGGDEDSSTYQHVQSDGTEFLMELSHSKTKANRERCNIRLTRNALVANPLVAGQNRPASLTVNVSVDRDALHTPQEAVDLYTAVGSFFGSGSFLKLASGET